MDRLIGSTRLSQSQRYTLNLLDPAVKTLIAAAEACDQNARHQPGGAIPIAPESSVSYCSSGVTMCIEHPGGGTAEATVCVRRLWCEGAAVIHMGFLHADTRCEIVLETTDQIIERIPARVRLCRLISRNAHDIELAFDKPIDLEHFVRNAGLVASAAPQRKVPQSICGRAVCLCSTSAEGSLLRYHLGATRLEIETFEDPGQAIDHIKRELTDLFICEMDIESMPGEEIIKAIRQTGYDIAILALTADTRRVDAAREAGAAMVLTKPYDAKSLLAAVQAVAVTGAKRELGPVQSTLAGDKDVAGAITSYVEHVGQVLRAMRDDMARDDLVAMRAHVIQLRGGGQTFGFAALTEAAAAALKTLDATFSIEESRGAMEGLIATAKRLEPPPAEAA